MPARDPAERAILATMGGLRKADPEADVTPLRQQLTAVRAERFIRALRAAEPPLTGPQRAQLAMQILDEGIKAAADDAPPLADDLAARITVLIRGTCHASTGEAA